MAISTTSRSSTSSRESMCLNQNLPKYVLGSSSSCGFARKRRSSGLLAQLRSKLCFCRNDHSTEDDCDIDGRVALNGSGGADDTVRCTRHDLRLVHIEKSTRSFGGSVAATDERSSTLPAVHRSCNKTLSRTREGERRTNGGASGERSTNRGMMTAPRLRSDTSERKRFSDSLNAKKSSSDELQTSPLLPVVRCSTLSRSATRKSPTLASATVADVCRAAGSGDNSSDGGTVKIEPDKWRLSEESSRPSSGEAIDDDDDEVYESYETTCSEPQQPGLSLPPVYDQVGYHSALCLQSLDCPDCILF